MIALFIFAAGCTRTYWLSDDFVPRYSEYIGWQEHELVQQLGTPVDVIRHDRSGLRYLVYNTIAMDSSAGNYEGFRCSTVFLSNKGRITASYYDRTTCIQQ